MSHDPYGGFPAAIAAQLMAVFRNSGWALTVQWQVAVCKARFADGRMLLVNYDISRNRLWLAGGESGSEYIYRDGQWLSVHDGTELFADVAKRLDALANANPQAARKGPLETRAVLASQPAEPAPAGSRLRWHYLLLPVLAFAGYRYFAPPVQPVTRQALPPPARTMPPANAAGSCEPNRPAPGTSWTSDGRSGPAPSARVSISNKHSSDMVVFLTRPGSAVPLQSVYLRARSQADMPVVPGEYELMFSVGNIWCSLEAGFKDGDRSKLNQRFSLQAEQPLLLELQSTGPQAAAFGVFVRKAVPATPPPVQILGDGEMRLQQAQDGHYYLQGSVNGRAVDFLVDTGASYTTLKQDIAVAGGIQDCRATQSKTANGIVDVCIGIIPEIRIGAYIVQNAVVVANPKTEANLLGMNVLGQFRIRTENGVMTLTRP